MRPARGYAVSMRPHEQLDLMAAERRSNERKAGRASGTRAARLIERRIVAAIWPALRGRVSVFYAIDAAPLFNAPLEITPSNRLDPGRRSFASDPATVARHYFQRRQDLHTKRVRLSQGERFCWRAFSIIQKRGDAAQLARHSIPFLLNPAPCARQTFA